VSQPVLIWHYTDIPGDLEDTVARTQDPSWIAYFHPSLDPDNFDFIRNGSAFAPLGLSWFHSAYGKLAVAANHAAENNQPGNFEVVLTDRYTSYVWTYAEAQPHLLHAADQSSGRWLAEVPNHVLVGHDLAWLEDGSEFATDGLGVHPQQAGTTLFVGW
jgi:hypothetical protein